MGMQQLLLFLDLGPHLSFPAYWLVRATHAPLPSFAHWKGLMEAAYGVTHVLPPGGSIGQSCHHGTVHGYVMLML